MSTLVEEVAKLLYEQARADDDEMLPYNDTVSYWLQDAAAILALIQNHPETLERRRKDFQAGADATYINRDEDITVLPNAFSDYLAAEKK